MGTTATLPLWLQQVTEIAGAIVTIALAIVVLAAIPVLLAIRQQIRRGTEEVTRAVSGAAPLIGEAVALLNDLRAIGTSLRANATLIHDSLSHADARFRSRVAELECTRGRSPGRPGGCGSLGGGCRTWHPSRDSGTGVGSPRGLP